MLRAAQLDIDRAFVLVIDLQEKLLPLIPRREQIIRAVKKLLDGVRIFNLPVLATEQYSKGLGPTDSPIRVHLGTTNSAIIEKLTFSACGQGSVRDAIRSIDRPQVLIAGIETHICVLQTTLDLITMDYDVFVCADAVGSRGRLDHDVALDRMRQEGAFVTTVESALFELCTRCDTDEFKKMLDLIKASPPHD
ncbi:MAG: hydrolase [Planctomycetes bacterium]|nr:hydrolase [Planctomycetota bacterium]